jgi:hypothetical protein
LGGSDTAEASILDLVCGLVELKEKSHLSSAAVEGVLDLLRRLNVLPEVFRNALPKSYDQMLRCLAALGCDFGEIVTYKACECGNILRCVSTQSLRRCI